MAGNPRRIAREVIALAVGFEAGKREPENFSHQIRIVVRDHAQSFCPAGARRLEMYQTVRCLGNQGIGGELVGAGVQGQLVRAERPSDLGVDLEVTLQPIDVPDVLHTLLEAADRKSTRLNSSHTVISYAVFCLKKKNT